MKIKTAMSTLRGVDVKTSVDFALNCGFDGIEIQTDYLPEDTAQQDEIILYAINNGLLVSLHSPCGDINISALNRGIRRESITQVKMAIELAQKHSLRVVTVHPGRLSSARENQEEKWNIMLEAVSEIAAYAKEKKVYTAIENMELRKKELVYTISDLNRFQKLAEDNHYFGVTLDFSHFATNKIFLPELSNLRLPVYNVHISQCVEGKPHMPLYENGEVRLSEIMDLLEENNYHSPIVLELKSVFDAEIYKKSKAILSK